MSVVRRGVSLDVAAFSDSDGSQDGDEHMIQPTLITMRGVAATQWRRAPHACGIIK